MFSVVLILSLKTQTHRGPRCMQTTIHTHVFDEVVREQKSTFQISGPMLLLIFFVFSLFSILFFFWCRGGGQAVCKERLLSLHSELIYHVGLISDRLRGM